MKFIGDATQTFRGIKVRNFSGIVHDIEPAVHTPAAMYMSDDGTGALSGCIYESFDVDGLSWQSFDPLAALVGIFLGQKSAHGKIVVKNLAFSSSMRRAIYLDLGTTGSVRQLDLLDCDWFNTGSANRQPVYVYSGIVQSLRMSGTFKLNGTGVSSAVVYVDGTAGTLVHNLIFENVRYEGSASNTGCMVAINGAVSNLRLINVMPLNPLSNGFNIFCQYYPNANGAETYAAYPGFNVYYTGCHMRGNNALADGGNSPGTNPVNVFAASTFWDKTGGGNFVNFSGPSAIPCTVYAGSDCKISVNALNLAGGALYSLFAPTLKTAVNGGTAGTTIARTAGATFFNTAAAGTLVANNVVMCDATATENSWKQLTALGNTY
jgi:hypothetical protein